MNRDVAIMWRAAEFSRASGARDKVIKRDIKNLDPRTDIEDILSTTRKQAKLHHEDFTKAAKQIEAIKNAARTGN